MNEIVISSVGNCHSFGGGKHHSVLSDHVSAAGNSSGGISIILARNFIISPCNLVTQYLCAESIIIVESADKLEMLDRKQLEKES